MNTATSWWESTFGQAQQGLAAAPQAAAGVAEVAAEVQEAAAAISLRRSLTIALVFIVLGVLLKRLGWKTAGVSLLVAGLTVAVTSIAQYS